MVKLTPELHVCLKNGCRRVVQGFSVVLAGTEALAVDDGVDEEVARFGSLVFQNPVQIRTICSVIRVSFTPLSLARIDMFGAGSQVDRIRINSIRCQVIVVLVFFVVT